MFDSKSLMEVDIEYHERESLLYKTRENTKYIPSKELFNIKFYLQLLILVLKVYDF